MFIVQGTLCKVPCGLAGSAGLQHKVQALELICPGLELLAPLVLGVVLPSHHGCLAVLPSRNFGYFT